MGSSPGFGSTRCDNFFALFGLAFAAAPGVPPLAWPRKVTRWVILQEARRHTFTADVAINTVHSASTARRHTVSGTIALP